MPVPPDTRCSWCRTTATHMLGTGDDCCPIHYMVYFARHAAMCTVDAYTRAVCSGRLGGRNPAPYCGKNEHGCPAHYPTSYSGQHRADVLVQMT